MGGGSSTSFLQENESGCIIHTPSRNSITKTIKKGGFSAGPKTMDKIRTRSDFSLLKLIEEETVRAEFLSWTKKEGMKVSQIYVDKTAHLKFFPPNSLATTSVTPGSIVAVTAAPSLHILQEAEVHLEFILAVDEMKKSRSSSKITEIYHKFIPPSVAKSLLPIDNPTRMTVMLAFATKTFDSRVFDLAYEKSYQILKFDYLSKFLISEAFMNLEKGTTRRRGSSDKVIDMRSLLVEARAFDCIVKFLQRNNKYEEYLPYARCWEEIHHFVLDYDKMTGKDQNKKAKAIYERTLKDVKMPSHLKALTNENVNGNTNLDEGPGKDTFDDLSHFLCDMLQTKIQKSFLFSEHYTEFLSKASKEYILDSVIFTLSDFKDDRGLIKTKENYDKDFGLALRLENVLDDPILSAYFRRYMRLSFCEENYLFFMDVELLKKKNYVKEAAKLITRDMNLNDIIRESGRAIYDKYIALDSDYQINVSENVRDQLDLIFKEGSLEPFEVEGPNSFNLAQREIFHEMRNGEFMNFKKHALFNHFTKNHKLKFAQRNFVVGNNSKKLYLLEHHERKTSSLNFDGVRESDKNFSFDAITQQNVDEFEKSMNDGLKKDFQDAFASQNAELGSINMAELGMEDTDSDDDETEKNVVQEAIAD